MMTMDDAFDAKVLQSPRRMFAAGTTAEILARDQNFRFAIGWLVQDKIRALRPVIMIADIGEGMFAKASSLDGFQELLGDDHVGIDIGHGQRGRNGA